MTAHRPSWPAPGQPPFQVWWGWGPGEWSGPAAGRPGVPVRTEPAEPPAAVRIGDAERDRAVSDLGDHFAAGRLSREEFDERAETAMRARFAGELRPLFVDLPAAPAPSPAPPQRSGPPPWVAGLWLLPLVLVGLVVASVLLHAPVLLWGLVWLAVIFKATGHRRRQHGPPFITRS